MTSTGVQTLPGVSFESAPPALDTSLPRMDVCAFVGIAASGPLHVPVAVEDVGEFRDIFGSTPVLAQDKSAPATPYGAHLGGAVEAFFSNGGKRAWVVRVAEEGEGGATTNYFTVPHLVVPGSLAKPSSWRLATLPARSAGSWSDDLRAGAALRVAASAALSLGESGALLDASVDVVTGDLLRADFGDGREGMFLVRATSVEVAGLRIEFEPLGSWWIEPADLDAFAAGPAWRLGGQVADDIPLVQVVPVADGALSTSSLPDSPPETGEFVLTVDPISDLAEGDLLAVPARDGEPMMLIELGPEIIEPAGSIPTSDEMFAVARAFALTASPPSWFTDEFEGPSGSSVVVEVLRLDLQAWRGERLAAELQSLGFAMEHPRYVGALPTDEELYSRAAELPRYGDGPPSSAEFATGPVPELSRDAATPRFPLAGVTAAAPTLLPFGMATRRSQAAAGPAPAAAGTATALERDGVADFGAHLFVDGDLARLGTRALLSGAFDKAYVADPARKLRGIHSLLAIDEVTLLVVPDATHPGWTRETVEPPAPLGAPLLHAPEIEDGAITLSWTSVQEATSYELEQDDDPTFENDPQCYEVADLELGLPARCYCHLSLNFRVRATRGFERGPWSNIRTLFVPEGTFAQCPVDANPPPVEVGSFPESGSEPVGATVVAPEAAGPVTVWRVVEPPEDEPASELRAIHTAMIRMCAARADMTALLSLPVRFRAADAISYVSRLTGMSSEFDATGAPVDAGLLPSGIIPLGDSEVDALSFAAVYHPWIATGSAGSAESTGIAPSPPDGSMAGVYALRALERGAWIAPANVPIEGGLGLSPTVSDHDRRRMVTAGINPFGRDPRGIGAIGSDTLSTEAALRPVNVRRLMILLRRLAHREGATYVFEPNDDDFRRLVQMRFETLLAGLYRRGAFVGATPDEAFEVATDDSVNPPGTRDQGRFVVELRVAPSQPMKFVKVRLVLAGPESLTLAEV